MRDVNHSRHIWFCVLVTWWVGSSVVSTCRGAEHDEALSEQATAILERYRQNLLADFEERLDDPQAYAKRVEAECGNFPEGDMFPFLLPAYAYTSLAAMGDVAPEVAAERIATLIELTRPAVQRQLRLGDRSLTGLRHYRRNAVYLAHFVLAMGCYKAVGGDDRYDAEFAHGADLLERALHKADGRPLESLPGLMWPFDTVPALLALQLRDTLAGGEERPSDELVDRHFKWLAAHATDEETGLPMSRLNARSAQPITPPRGSALAWRIMLTKQFAPEQAADWQQRFTKHYWTDALLWTGFREWPEDVDGRMDLDSGPILAGMGATATVFGLGACLTTGDTDRAGQLLEQLDQLPQILETLVVEDSRDGQKRIAGMIRYRSGYRTGFLFGDATLFHAITPARWLKMAR